ncbi:MAG TPA: ComEC/Rec2 family competence protein, partial [Bacteroidia bacterium]|nr:ComEC/Rec2 family competence protein [Bacteroidia bacterium]
MKPWNAAPLLRILLPLILGISAAILTPVDIPHLNHLLIVLFSLLFLMLIFPALKSYKNSWYYGCILNVLLVSIGFQLTREKMDQHSTAHFSKHLKNTTWIHARIDKAIVEKEKSVKAIVQILSVDGKPTEIVFGKAIVYFQKDERALHLNYGDEIVLKKEFKEIPPARNPGTFDYKRWLFYKNITQQAFLKKQQWVYMGKNSGNTIIAYSIRIRNELLNILKQAQLKDDELAMASALLLGYTNTLEQDLISAYAQTGALHILSVSGLHVGIVFIVLNTLLSFLDKFKYGLCLKTLLLITALWCYAFISGLSPSVMRAAIMLSFIVYAKSFKKNSSIYNTLAASALFLLLYDPFYLVDVGFQLSYLAVLGI